MAPGGTQHAARPAREQVLSLRIERDTALTEIGIGAGTRCWVRPTPRATHVTDIEMLHYLPENRPEPVEMRAGRYLARLEQLWSEDEMMMVQRETALARAGQPRPPQEPVVVGPPEALPAARKLSRRALRVTPTG